MANFIPTVFCAALAAVLLTIELVDAQPITKEEADSLLPDLPKTKNETIAAIVKDTVVQQAVGSVVGDGSLSGLVVKKNTVILPVNEPEVVLSHQEQILTAPLSDLENIRKNITQTTAVMNENENSDVTEVEEISFAEVIPIEGKLTQAAEVTPSLVPTPDIEEDPSGKIPDQIFTQSLILTGVIGDKIPEHRMENNSNRKSEISDSLSVEPKLAAPLPLSSESSEESSSGEENSSGEEGIGGGQSAKETLEFGARIPVAIITAEESDFRPAVKLENGRSVYGSETGIEGGDSNASEKNIFAIFTVPDEELYRRNDDNDMTAAEDIIFRPLFRYRQQQNERTRVLENRAYQKLGYRRHDRRRPPSSAGAGYSDYNYNYKRRHGARYYDDY